MTQKRKRKTKWNYRNIFLLALSICFLVGSIVAIQKVRAVNTYSEKDIAFGDMHFTDSSIIPKQKDWNVTVFTNDKTFVWKIEDVQFQPISAYKKASQTSRVTFEYNKRGKMKNVIIYLTEDDRRDYSKRYADMFKSSMLVGDLVPVSL